MRSAVFWRSGSQIVAQIITWGSTFLVIRMLEPGDYGLVAMATVLLAFLNLMNGYGFASSLIQRESIDRRAIRQVFGLLLLLNTGLALAQLALAPLAAAYFREPMVAELLRVSAVSYLITPFIALPFALLSRELEYRKQALANLAGSLAGAATALALAWLGYGVWALVFAPIALFGVKAIGLTIGARSLVWPSFSFKGAGAMIGFGGAMTATQLFWFLQSQSDVFIGGRVLDPHNLGLYTTALFLTQILAAKFVPPLNDVAFATYSRMQGAGGDIAGGFAKSVRMIMLAALPFYFGLAVTAEPLVLVILGEGWAGTIPLVAILAQAMPFLTLQILFAPATNARGRPWLAVRINMLGALIMPIAFLIGINWGTQGMAWAWLTGFPLLTLATIALSLPVIGLSLRQLGAAILPALAASGAMAALVYGADVEIARHLDPLPRLALLVGCGITAYACYLVAFAREALAELWSFASGRPLAAA
ncbi:MAG: lipopolysaccharide biosynthesis protein [Sphingomonadaceae bacterium]|nr:lipopolysaccharide biosynthesis protein [Sphingomonadaceae bacterium]